jgi:hypothetical protein
MQGSFSPGSDPAAVQSAAFAATAFIHELAAGAQLLGFRVVVAVVGQPYRVVP